MDTGKAEHIRFLMRASELARQAVDTGSGGPFGAVIVKDGKIIAEGYNRVTSSNDPTAHAEIVAIRKACENLATFQLDGCVIYSSCEPCPMCMGAVYWARPSALYYSAGRDDAAAVGFDDAFIYEELALPEEKRNLAVIRIPVEEAVSALRHWQEAEQKTRY